MPAITGAIMAATAVAGLGVSIYGQTQAAHGRDQQQSGYGDYQAAIRAQQAAIVNQASYIPMQQAGVDQQVQGAQEEFGISKQISQTQQAIQGVNYQAMQFDASQKMAALDLDANQRIESLRRSRVQQTAVMEMDARRKQVENLRNFQSTRALALTAATAQGAQFGSGLQGGYGQISGQSHWNALGINQALQQSEEFLSGNTDAQISGINLSHAIGARGIQGSLGFGEQLYGLNNNISGLNQQYADAGTKIAEGQGTSARAQGYMALAQAQAQYAQSQGALAQGLISQGGSNVTAGGSYVGTGIGLMNSAQMFGKVGGTLFGGSSSTTPADGQSYGSFLQGIGSGGIY